MGRVHGATSAVPVSCLIGFGAVGTMHRISNATVENHLEVSSLEAGRVRVTVISLRVRAGAAGAWGRLLATRVDVAEPPTIVTLFEVGRRVGSLNDIIATKDGDSGEPSQELLLFGQDLHHHRAGYLIVEARGAVGVEKVGLGDEDGMEIQNRGLEEVRQGSILLVVSLDSETMNGKLQIGGGKVEGQAGIVVNWEGLIELLGESIEKRGVGSRRNGTVDNGEGHCTIVVNKDFNANQEA